MFAALILQPGTPAMANGNRRIVYVHGICAHEATFSDAWWAALQPFEPLAFGAGTLGETRLEVVWSDIVSQAATARAIASESPGGAATGAVVAPSEVARQRAAAEIKEALRDRRDQHAMNAAAMAGGVPGAAPMPAASFSVPWVNCIDDFASYLVDDTIRQQIIDRFIQVVRPELLAGHELDIICHSWGTVITYEALRQLEDQGLAPPLVRNLFTVGAALSIGPVKMRLRAANQDGRKPASVRRWVNLDAHDDLVGGPLEGRPYAVDDDFVNLQPIGCADVLGLVDPVCAHGSYFNAANLAVNRDIFAKFIDRP
jgi:hypothetical protein